MELEREESFDDAFSDINDANEAEPNKSDSQLTLKYVRSQESLKRFRKKYTSTDLNSDAIHFELLVEKGLIDEDDESPGGHKVGDHLRSMDGGAIAEIVKEMRNEFMTSLSSKAKNLQEILIKNGIMDHPINESVRLDDSGETHFIRVSKENQLKENRLPKDSTRVLSIKDTTYPLIKGHAHLVDRKTMIEDSRSIITVKPDSSGLNSNVNTGYEHSALQATDSRLSEMNKFTEFSINRENEMMQWIDEINLFTSEMERDPENVNWGLFRANLIKMHKHYVTHEPKSFSAFLEPHSEIPSVGLTADFGGSLKDLGSRVECIRSNIQGLECKILTLDHCFERFCAKLSRSSIAKGRVDRDLKILAMLRERIDRRLSQMEIDFCKTKKQLICQEQPGRLVVDSFSLSKELVLAPTLD
ncbi:uncharacterized protein Dana_GF23443 [Drosophila ananassae]|uniref:Uncharacterized protein n=1 Tax=Drosophila ananassae TaxID=7217 RepID=B3MB92_DROAN|nr:uncharacterized protein LOC6506084 [Drosophila ananassae]EDV41393.2 uncharacterized protein Dana_GF23443 [Drosophila ananassae]